MLAVCLGQLGQEESYEDSDQTPLEGREANILRHQWGGGWRPQLMQPWTHSTQAFVPFTFMLLHIRSKSMQEAVLRISDIWYGSGSSDQYL